MKRVSLAVFSLLFAACLTACGGFERAPEEDFESELADSLADSLRSVSDASSAVSAAGFAGGDFGGCAGEVTVLSTEPFCSVQHDAHVRVVWSCVGPQGNGLTGTADIDTALVPDACPPSSVDVTQAMTMDRQWRFGHLAATLTGTAELSWEATSLGEPAQKIVTVDLDHRVRKDDEVLRHQLLAGTRTVSFDENGPGDADDARLVDGAVSIDFVLAGVHADVTETDLTFRRGCCHPVAGTLGYALSGETSREGTITFGPGCGGAKTDDGRVLDLAPCSVD